MSTRIFCPSPNATSPTAGPVAPHWWVCCRDPIPCPPRAAAQVTDGSQYHVLLIITDGVISDMLQTKEAIVTVSASSLL